jgi:hypothetical protein
LLGGNLVSVAQELICAIGTGCLTLQALETLYIGQERRALRLGHLERGIVGRLLQRVALLNCSRIIVTAVTLQPPVQVPVLLEISEHLTALGLVHEAHHIPHGALSLVPDL